MTTYKGKGVYSAVAVGKISVFKRQDVQVKRIKVENADNELKRLEDAKAAAITQLGEIYEKAVADFEALYPNVKVTLRLYTDYGRIYNDVITNIATGTTPNVCITYPDHIATYLTGEDTVVPLDGLMVDEKFGLGGSEVRFESPKKDEIIAKYLEEGMIGDTHYAIPFLRSTEACYVNKTLLKSSDLRFPKRSPGISSGRSAKRR